MKKFLNIVLTVLLLAGCSAEESAAQSEKKNCSMKVATYNLRMDTEKDGQNAWPNRKELVKELIVKYDFDIQNDKAISFFTNCQFPDLILPTFTTISTSLAPFSIASFASFFASLLFFFFASK